jgi:LPXTG-motif cell wall-anchored protein
VPFIFDSNGFSSDLADFITGAVVKDSNGVPVPTGGAVHVGDSYTIELAFAEPNAGKQFKYDGDGWLTYQLPDVITVPTLQTGSITGAGILPIGNYAIAAGAGSTIKVRFFDVDKDGEEIIPPENFIDHYGNANFVIYLQAQFNSTGGNDGGQIVFGENVVVSITVDPDPYITVEKTAGSYNPATHTIEGYTVEVTAHSGTVDNIVLTDVMDIGPWYFYAYSLRYDKLSIQGSVNVAWPGGPDGATVNATVAAVHLEHDYHGGRYKIPLTGVTLEDGQTATVTYSVLVSDALLAAAGPSDKYPVNGYNFKNTVTAGGISGVEPVKPVSATAGGDFRLKHLDKTGAFSYDPDSDGKGDIGDKVKWTVVAGDGFTDLRGVDITDTLGSGLSILPSTINVWLCEYASTENTPQYDKNHAIGGAPYVYGASTRNAGDFTSISGQNAGFTLTVPSDQELETPVRRVVIEYEAEVTVTDQQDGYSNHVAFTYPDGRGGYENTATVGNFVEKMEKTGVLVEDDADGIDENDYIEYTISVQVPGRLNGKVVYIKDGMRLIEPVEPYRWVMVDNKPPKEHMTVDIKVGGVSVPTGTYTWDLVYGDDSNFLEQYQNFNPSEPITWYLLFNAQKDSNDVPNPTGAKWNISADSIVTVTYRIPLAAEILEGMYEGRTLAEGLRDGSDGSLYNVARMVLDGSEKVYGDGYLIRPIAKSGSETYLDNGDWVTKGEPTSPPYSEADFYEANTKGFAYSVSLNRYPPATKYDLAPDGIDPVFSDSFDSRLALHQDKTKWEGVLVYAGDGGLYYVDPDKLVITPGALRTNFSFDFGSDLIVWDASIGGWKSVTIDWDKDVQYGVVYTLLIEDESALGEGTTNFLNTASISIKYPDGWRRLDADAKTSYGKPIITKEMAADSGTTVKVDIVVNPEGKKLGVPSANTITVKDTMSSSLSFVDLSQIEVIIDGHDVSAQHTPDYSPIDNSITFDHLPDETKIEISYRALVVGAPGQAVNVSNTVCIEGYSESAAEAKIEFKVTSSGASGGGSRNSFSLLKTDSDDAELRLSGAAFALYINVKYGGWQDDGPDAKMTIPAGQPGEGTYYYLLSASSGEMGTALFANQYILPGSTFLILETEAPPGYRKLDGPLLVYMVSGDNNDPYNGAAALIANDGLIPVGNETAARFPETGGAGAGMYAAVGAAAMALAAALLAVARRRRLFDDSA